MSNLTWIELYNVQEGDSTFVSMAEREKNPGAEYFTAQIETKHVGRVLPRWEPDEVKSVTLTFRKLITVKDGKVTDAVKGGEHTEAVAVRNGGKNYLRTEATQAGDEIIGVLVRTVFHYEE